MPSNGLRQNTVANHLTYNNRILTWYSDMWDSTPARLDKFHAELESLLEHIYATLLEDFSKEIS